MNTKLSTNRKFRRMFVNILSIFVILALAFPAVGSVYAQEESPWLRAFPDQDFVDGSNWPAGQAVHLDITDQGFDAIANENGEVVFDLAGYDLERGHTLTMSSGDIFVTYTARQLFVEDISVDTQTISGTVDGQQTIHFWVGDAIDEYVDTDADGNWSVDLSNYEEAVLTPGTCGNAEAWGDDASSSSTIIDWCVPEPPPNPHFTVFPEWEWFDGLDWPDGAIVSISVEGKSECYLERESWGGFFNGNFPDGCNVEAGDTVTFDDGTTNPWHTVRNLYVIDVDTSENTVAGKADAGETVYVWPHDGWFEPLQTIVDGSGMWQVDFDDVGYDIQNGSEGRSEIRDGMGNATASDWHVTHPRFTVFPEWEWFDGNDWPNEAMVNITVEGKPECETVKESWGYFFNGNFGEGCDLEIGDTVTFTDGETIQIHTVQNLAITKANHEDDTIKGIADAGAEVYVWPHATGEQQLVVAKTKGAAEGKWNVDFSGIFDLTPGECGRSEIRDEVGNSTAVDWCIPRIEIKAFPMVDVIWGYGWPEGSQVHLTLNGAVDFVPPATVGPAPWGDPNDIMAYFELTGYDLVPGDVVTLSGSGREQTHTVLNLSVTAVNATADTVTGMADQELYVWVHGFDGTELHMTPEDGMWLADFGSIPFDLTDGMCGRAEIGDEAGNSTAADWCVPPPARIVASITEDWFYLVDFAPDAAFDYAIYESQGGTQVAEGSATTDGSGFAWINADGNWDIEPGYFLIVSDGTSTKALVIEGFTFDVFDLTQGLLQGTALGAEGRLIWVGIGFENDGWSMEVFTDADGNWVADFGQPVPADYWWVAAQIFDDDGDASELRPEQIIAWGE